MLPLENRPIPKTSPYDPGPPHSASKAASDHLVTIWHHTYGLPVVPTTRSNNYCPYQFREKSIRVVIFKAMTCEPIPLYRDGANMRDRLYGENHVDAILQAAAQSQLRSLLAAQRQPTPGPADPDQGNPARQPGQGGHSRRCSKSAAAAVSSEIIMQRRYQTDMQALEKMRLLPWAFDEPLLDLGANTECLDVTDAWSDWIYQWNNG